MTVIKNYNFSLEDITSLVIDNTNGEFIWVAFNQNTSGNCVLRKVSAHNPLAYYYTINIAVDEIKKLNKTGSYLYCAYDDSLLIGAKYSISSPLSNATNFSLPAGITEAPIDIIVNGTDVFYLIPGNLSGTNAKICYFDTDGNFQETIDLATVTNANSFAIDSSGDIWIGTYSSPSTYVRVYQLSNGTWTYTVHS